MGCITKYTVELAHLRKVRNAIMREAKAKCDPLNRRIASCVVMHGRAQKDPLANAVAPDEYTIVADLGAPLGYSVVRREGNAPVALSDQDDFFPWLDECE